MQYNKQQFNKVNDKKIMKKVKKQWVVVSVASLAVLGGFAVSGTLNMNQPSVVAHAASTTGDQGQKSGNVEQHDGDQGQKSGNVEQHDGDQGQKSGNVEQHDGDQGQKSGNVEQHDGDQGQKSGNVEQHDGDQGQKSGNVEQHDGDQGQKSGNVEQHDGDQGQKSGNVEQHDGDQGQKSGNVEQHDGDQGQKSGNVEQHDGDQGQKSGNVEQHDGDQVKSGSSIKAKMSLASRISLPESLASSKIAGEQVNETNISGFNDALNNSSMTEPFQGKGQDYNDGFNLGLKYRQAIYDGSNNKSNSQPSVDSSNDYHDAAQKGYSAAYDAYNNSLNQGTDSDYRRYNGTNNNPDDASNTTKEYESKLGKDFNTNQNSSIKNINGGKVSINTSVDDSTYKSNLYLDASYKYGANAFFAQQGEKDAKSGKWQGTSYNNNKSAYSNGSNVTKDFYDGSTGNTLVYDKDNKDSYYQSYEGTKQAIFDQFSSNTGQNSSSTSTDDIYQGLNNYKGQVDNSSYVNAYNNVVKDSKNGIAYVQNANQLNNLMTGQNSSYSSIGSSIAEGGYINKNINNIKLVNDVNYIFQNGTTDSSNDKAITNNSSITIDGQNHIADMQGVSYNIMLNDNSYSFNVKNFKTVYGGNYYGPFTSNKGSAYISNFNYVGPQMLQSTGTDVYIGGNVNVYQNFNDGAYNSPFGKNSNLNAPTSQQNLYVNNLVLQPGSNYFGGVNAANGAAVVELTGNLTLGEDSNMTLIPRGNTGDNSSKGTGVELDGTSASLNIGKNANLNITPDKANGDSNKSANAIYTYGGNVNVDGGNINVETINGFYQDNAIYLSSGTKVNIINDGSIYVKSKYNSTSKPLLNNSGGSFNINGGNLFIDASDSTNMGSFSLISGNITVNNPGSVGVVLKKNGNETLLSSGSNINANSVSVKNGNNNNLYYQYNVNSSGNVTGINANGSTISSGSITNGNDLEISQVPSAYIIGPVTAKYDKDKHTITINGKVSVIKREDLSSDNNLYLSYNAYNGDNPNPIGHPVKNITAPNDKQDKAYGDQTSYYDRNDTKADNTPFTFTETINDVNGDSPSKVITNLKYGVQGLQILLQPSDSNGNYNNETVSSQKFGSNTPSADGRNIVPKDVSKVLSTNNGYIDQAIRDGINDKISNSDKNKNDKLYGGQEDGSQGYKPNYDAAQQGYEAYKTGNGNNIPSYADAATLNAYKQGYQAAADNKGSNDYINGLSPKYTDSGSPYYNGYESAKSGYSDGLHGNTKHQKDATSQSGYSVGNSAGQKASVGYQGAMSSSNPDPSNPQDKDKSNISNSDNPNAYNAYQGAAQAIQDINSNNNDFSKVKNSNSGNNRDYDLAYSQAVSDAKDANQKAQDDFNAGNPLNTNDLSKDDSNEANKNIYTNAYNDYQKGYQEGLSGNKPANMTPNEEAGYNSSRNISAGNDTPGANDLSKGYKEALDDFYNKGVKTLPASFEGKDKGYEETIKGLIDGKANPSPDNQPGTNKPLYEIARAQSVGAQNGINDAKNSTTTNAPDGVNSQAYNTAHDAAKSGYNDENGQTDYDSKQFNNPVYTNSFAQGSQQRGADDYLNGNYDSNKSDGSKDGNYSKGANAAKDGLNDSQVSGLNDPTHTTDINNKLNGKSDAYANAFKQGVYANKGYQDATSDNDGSKAPTLSEDKSNQAEVDAYWGAQAGANTGKSYNNNPTDSKPNTGSQFYKNAEQRAQQDISKGAQDYINDKSQGKTDLTPSGNDSLYNQGYNNQNAYDAGFNNPNAATVPSEYSQQSTSYQAGQRAANNDSEFNSAKNSSNPKLSSDNSKPENDGAVQGFNDAKNGQPFNSSKGMTGADSRGDNATKYQGAYAKAYAEATDQMNKGAQQYSSDKNNGKSTDAKPTDKSAGNQDAQSFNQGYDNQRAYDAGLNNKSGNDDVPSDYANNASAYKAGKNASKANEGDTSSPIKGANTDANSDNPSSDTTNKPKSNNNGAQDAYDGAKAGYVDGSNGSPANINVGKSSDYQQAYNKAYGDMQKSRQAGTNDFFGKVNGNSLNDPNAIKTVASSAKDGKDINSKAHNNAFAEQQGYAAGLAGQNNNPYTDSGNGSNHDAYENAYSSASKASKGYKAAQNSSDPTSPENADKAMSNLGNNDSAKEAYQAASQAFADAKANKPSDNSGKDANYKNAYNMAYNQNRAAMSEGENDALGKDGENTNIPSDITTASAKALYDAAKGNASQGYADAMKPSNANNANAPEGSSKEYTDGYNQAKSISAGANAAIAGAKQAPTASGNQNQDQVNAGFNAAQKAIKNGLADAQSGKNRPNNGKFDENQIFSGAKDVPSTARQAYIDAYEGAYNGYNNGLNGGSQKPSSDKDAKYGNDTTYSAAYDNAFKQGQNDIPAPTPTPAPNNDKDDQAAGIKAGQQAFAGGTPLNINHVNFAGKSEAYKKAFTKGYNDAQAGFNAGLNGGKNNNSDNPSFKAGYQSAQAYKQGVKDATRGKKPAKNSSDAYKVGYEAYKEGISGKKANKATLDKLAPAYRKAYEKNYQAARKAYVAVSGKASKAARKNAVGTKRVPRGLKHESPAYQAAYMEAFNRYVKDNLPSYVYNLKKIYSHDAPALTRSTRVKKYGKNALYNRHVFKVTGYKITSSGHVVYRVKGLGWISASDKSVSNVYYRHNDTKKPIQKVRVIKPQGTYIYNSKSFNKKTAVKKMKKGSTVNVERIERVGGITRFYIGNGQYISSNKTIVEHLR